MSRGKPFNGPALCRTGLRSKPILLTHWPKTCSRVNGSVEPQKAQGSGTDLFFTHPARVSLDLQEAWWL